MVDERHEIGQSDMELNRFHDYRLIYPSRLFCTPKISGSNVVRGDSFCRIASLVLLGRPLIARWTDTIVAKDGIQSAL